MPKKKVNVRKDYSYEAKKSLPKYAPAGVSRKILYLVLRGPGLDVREAMKQNEAIKAFAVKSRIKLKFLQAKDEPEFIKMIKDANAWAAGIVAHFGALTDETGNIKKAIKGILIETAIVKGDALFEDSFKQLLGR